MNTVTVRFTDLGAAAPLRAIKVTEGEDRIVLVHSGLSENEGFSALAALLDDPPLFPMFAQLREDALRDSA